MTREQRIEAAAMARNDPERYVPDRDWLIEALDAALADVGGLDGLTPLADLTDQSRPMEDRKAQLITTEFYERLLAAAVDRDRLRDVLREAERLRAEGLLWREIAERLGIARATAHAYGADPDGSKLAARKRSYAVPCGRCGGPTDGSRGRARPARLCQTCRNRDGVPVDERRARSRARRGDSLPRSRTITLREFAAGVRETADRLGSVSLSRIAYERHRADGLLSHPAVADRWRWNEIIEAAGLTPTRPAGDRDYHPVTADTALEAVRDCAAAVGRFPTAYLYDAWSRREGRVTRRTVLRALDVRSWMDVEGLL